MAKRGTKIMEVSEPLVNSFAAEHGDYQQLGEYNDARKALVNRGGTAIERWLNEKGGIFGESEKAAVRYCQALWQRIDKKGPRADGIRVYGRYLWIGQSEHEALAELAKIELGQPDANGAHPNRIPKAWWSVFEDVCRFHCSAADAGSLISSNSRSASDAAKTMTLAVSGFVAVRIGL